VIHTGDAGSAVPSETTAAPGGFLWWYADLIDRHGDGAVLIWSYGLPFLPGYATAARRGAPQFPHERPSVNLVVYRGGHPVFYLLQEHPPERVEGDLTHVQRIGRCTFQRSIEHGRCTLDAALDCDLPGGGRVQGTLRIDAVARRAAAGERDEGPHLWTPLTGPAEGTLELSVDGAPLVGVRGRAYHDRNAGVVPLHDLGIRRWMWGRVPLADRERIYYLLWPEGEGAPRAFGVDVDAAGVTRQVALEVETGRERLAFGGLRRPERIVLRHGERPWLEVRHRTVSDAGPFYLRLLSDAVTGEGERALGWSELVHPARVDLARHRPFVRMRVHRTEGGNSFWLPLFTGARAGRVRRLLRQLLPG
jgi:carotenoid 1,2-hydratase